MEDDFRGRYNKPKVMNNKNVNQSKSKVLFILLIVLFAPLMGLSQNEGDKDNLDGHDYNDFHISQIDFLPIDSVLEKVWLVHVKNKNCLPLIKGNLVFPSVVERVVIDASNGLTHKFGSQEAMRLFKKENLDSIICFPTRDLISLINIYTNQIIFSSSEGSLAINDGPFFPVNNVIYYGSNNVLYAYDYFNKKNIWQTEIDEFVTNFYQNYKNYIILNDRNNLLVIDRKTGKIIRKYKTRNYNSNILKGKDLYYTGSNEIVKVNLETLKPDTLLYTNTYDLGNCIFIEGDTLLYYSIRYGLYNFSLSNQTSKQITKEDVCSHKYVKINNYIIAEASEAPDGNFTTIYDIKKGLPKYKYFFVKQDGDFYTYDRCLYSFNPKLTSNGLLIGYTYRGEIQAFRFRNK